MGFRCDMLNMNITTDADLKIKYTDQTKGKILTTELKSKRIVKDMKSASGRKKSKHI